MTAIRRLLPLAAALLLPGCVLAVGNTPDEGGAVGKRLSAIEKRIGALEEKCDGCEGAACIDLGTPDAKSTMKVWRKGQMKVMKVGEGGSGNLQVLKMGGDF